MADAAVGAIGAGVVTAATGIGIRLHITGGNILHHFSQIPEDISLISIDCAPDLFPRMTTVEQALECFVQKALSLFNDAELTGGLIRSGFYQYDLKINERGSCRKLD
jgi:DNA-binding LacI/PurR family transcriptional regulator